MVASLVDEFKTWPELVENTVFAWQTAWLPRTRSIAGTDFLRADSKEVGDVLLMVDRDMTWKPGDAKYMAEKAYETRGVVGGLYSRRDFNIGLAPHLNEPGTWVQGEDRLCPAEFIGTGFVAIHREVFERLALVLPLTAGDFYPFFFNNLISNPRDPRKPNSTAYFPIFEGEGVMDPRSDDVTFSRYAKAAGSSIHVAMKPTIYHIGEYVYKPIDAQTPAPLNKQAIFKVAAAVDNRAFQDLPKDVADFLHIGLNTLDRRMKLADQELSVDWLTKPPQTAQDRMEFYAKSKNRIPLVCSSMRVLLGGAEEIEKLLSPYKNKKVFVYGVGPGSIPILLAKNGCEVWCEEPIPVLQEFLKFRLERNPDVADKIHWSDEKPFNEFIRQFDLVVTWDALQKSPSPERILKALTQVMKMGGDIFAFANFNYSQLYPMFTPRGGDQWSMTLKSHGLEAKEEGSMMLTLPDDFINLRMRPGFTMQVDRASLTGQPGMFQGVYEVEISEMVRSHLRQGDTFLDLGANVGYFSMLASPLCSKVVAVEPGEKALAALKENLRANQMENVTVVEAAVSDRSGTSVLTENEPYSLTNHLTTGEGAGVQTKTLHELIEEYGKPKIIKIDVEGAEILAFRQVTAEDLSETEWIFFEYHPEYLKRTSGVEDPGELPRRLDELGYELVAPGTMQTVSVNKFLSSIEDAQKQGMLYVNMFARRKKE